MITGNDNGFDELERQMKSLSQQMESQKRLKSNYDSLTRDVTELGVKKDQILLEIESLERKKLNIELIQDKYDNLINSIEKKKQEFKEVEEVNKKEKDVLLKFLNSIKLEVSNEENCLKNIKQEEKSIKSRVGENNRIITLQEAEIKTLKNKKEEDIKFLDTQIEEKQERIKELRQEDIIVSGNLSKAKNEINSFASKKEEHSRQIEQMKKELEAFKVSMEKHKEEIKSNLEQEKRNFEETKTEQAKQILEERQKFIIDIEAREGEISVKNDRLERQAEKLRSAKRELEEIHGKTLSHIFI